MSLSIIFHTFLLKVFLIVFDPKSVKTDPNSYLISLSDGVVDLRNLIGLEQCNNSHIALNFIIALRGTVQI